MSSEHTTKEVVPNSDIFPITDGPTEFVDPQPASPQSRRRNDTLNKSRQAIRIRRLILIRIVAELYVLALSVFHTQNLVDRNTLSLAVLDLDHFKSINDGVGHLAGDEVLRTFAHIAQKNVRQGDIFGR